jgi:hypothetical protein
MKFRLGQIASGASSAPARIAGRACKATEPDVAVDPFLVSMARGFVYTASVLDKGIRL